MEKKEVLIYFYTAVLIVAAIFAIYLFNLQLTGFAVFTQNTKAAFDEGTYSSSVEYDINDSKIILSRNQTNGTYTSKIFDSNNTNTTWNNISFSGTGVNFEARVCSNVNCTNSTFASANLSNLNLSGQYFQYKVFFDSANDSLQNVSIDYSVPVAVSFVPVTIDLLQPSGTKTSSPVSIEFAVTGANLTCWYNVQNKDDGSIVIGNTTLPECTNSTFQVSQDKRYLVSIYVNNSTGFVAADNSEFVYEGEGAETTEEEEEIEEEEPPVQSGEEQQTTQISLGEISTQDIVQGSSKQLSLSIQNTGNMPVSSCSLKGDDSGWITITEGAKNLATGENASFAFSVNLPDETAAGARTLGLSVDCAETSASRQITINVVEKKLDFNITEVQRTTQTRVRVIYTLSELTGQDQDVQIKFALLTPENVEVANLTQNRSIDANDTREFTASLRINESLNGSLTLSAAYNSQVFSSSVLEPITLGAPIGGFAIFGQGLGTTGSIAVILIVVVVLVVIFFVVKKLRVSGRTGGKISAKNVAVNKE